MSTLSEVTILVGQRARDIEKAREIFVAEIRAFVGGILSGIRVIRGEPWTAPRVRIVLPKEIENETKTTSDLSSHYAIARTELRFKKGTNFRQISDVRFGIEFDETSERFVWHVTLVPAAAYNRIDDGLWALWRSKDHRLPGMAHQDKANTVRFVTRPLDPEVTAELTYNDVKTVLEFLLTADATLADAVGVVDDD